MTTDTTCYSIFNECNQRTTISIEKSCADALQVWLPNVHAWVQQKYNFIVSKYPDLPRRKQGDMVRLLAWKEARNSPAFPRVDEL